jgi:DNA-binding NtrC family response regulator
VSRDLFESQLFGHRKGSFTGAISDTIGFVSQAEGGTLFLDEIADLSPDVQAKLLRLIDTKSYTRLGDAIERQADVRIVAATNKDLRKLISENLFRKDLNFRLNVLPITIPPLRDRREDIPELLADFQGMLRGKKLSKEAVRVLVNYPWPGNVRELRSILTRAGIDYEDEEIGPEIAEFFEKDFPTSGSVPENGKLDRIWQELKDGGTFWEVVWDPFIDRELDRETVRVVLSNAYSENDHSFKKMLQTLHIEDSKYQNFMSLMYKYQLTPNNKPLGLFNKPIS